MPIPPPPPRPPSLRQRHPVATRLAAVPGLLVSLAGIALAVYLYIDFGPTEGMFEGLHRFLSYFVFAWAVPPFVPLVVGVIRGGVIPHLLGYVWLIFWVLVVLALLGLMYLT